MFGGCWLVVGGGWCLWLVVGGLVAGGWLVVGGWWLVVVGWWLVVVGAWMLVVVGGCAGGREEEAERRRADTALKTESPRVNAGKNMFLYIFDRRCLPRFHQEGTLRLLRDVFEISKRT